MKCPLGHETQHFTGTKAYPEDRHWCDACKREYIVAREGVGYWIRPDWFCDGCDQPTWYVLVSPEFGLLALWPFPETRFPLFRTPKGPGSDSYRAFCTECCPRLGEDAPRLFMEIAGVTIEAAECVGFKPPPRERYPHLFTDDRGTFLRAWLSDHVGLSDEARDKILAEWEQDRAEEKSAALTESADG